jgi:hypothetical protein
MFGFGCSLLTAATGVNRRLSIAARVSTAFEVDREQFASDSTIRHAVTGLWHSPGDEGKKPSCWGDASRTPAPERSQMSSYAGSLQFSLRGRGIRCRFSSPSPHPASAQTLGGACTAPLYSPDQIFVGPAAPQASPDLTLLTGYQLLVDRE